LLKRVSIVRVVPHAFFCHAGEDNDRVIQIFNRLAQAHPEIQGWMDRYEIVAGDELIEKLAAGIEGADKFLVFLSEASIDKPWVKAELNKALHAEIEGVKPQFIVPIKIGAIPRVPPFLENKVHIDLEQLTEQEWLGELYRAIVGVPRDPASDEAVPNLG
jgi:TIR domain